MTKSRGQERGKRSRREVEREHTMERKAAAGRGGEKKRRERMRAKEFSRSSRVITCSHTGA